MLKPSISNFIRMQVVFISVVRFSELFHLETSDLLYCVNPTLDAFNSIIRPPGPCSWPTRTVKSPYLRNTVKMVINIKLVRLGIEPLCFTSIHYFGFIQEVLRKTTKELCQNSLPCRQYFKQVHSENKIGDY